PGFGLQVRNVDCLIALELNGRPGNYSKQLKRAIDVVLALVLVLLTAPIVVLLALAIKLVDPGPAFYGQWRVGQFGRPIRVLKLRTMYRDAEQRLERVLASSPDLRQHWGPAFKVPQDPRILLHVGNLMRRASLDELPQLWNVIRGDMSLVGPRPFPAYHMEAFDPEFRTLRASVPPGLTGLWQISSRSNGDLEAQRAEDTFYIRNRALWLDLYILIATVPAGIRATAREVGLARGSTASASQTFPSKRVSSSGESAGATSMDRGFGVTYHATSARFRSEHCTNHCDCAASRCNTTPAPRPGDGRRGLHRLA